jgi:RHS repeat-associated protein
MELDNEVKGNGNSYTTEFRQYDPRLGRWLSTDAMKRSFPAHSPYCYAMNNPVAGKDDNGLYTIFVNGYIYGTKPGASDDIRPRYHYWRPKFEKDKGQFIKAAHEYFGDGNHKYINGSGFDMSSFAVARQNQGRERGKTLALELLKLIEEHPEDIKELNFVTHSMGAAFAEGMIEELMTHDKIRELMEKGEIVHFSACDGDQILISENSKHLKRTQLNYRNDKTLAIADAGATETGGYQIEGVNRMGVVNSSAKKWQLKDADHDFHVNSKIYKEAWDFVRVLDKRMAFTVTEGKPIVMEKEEADVYNPGIRTGSDSKTVNK